jgi:pyruvate/2-oxoglutarate dehydrogenase complex dihydrolipoamide acyltransferase (E2) component
MAVEVLLPKLGLTMQEGTIEEWLVEPGTPVRSGDAILRLATDKVEVDVEAEADGKLHPIADVGSILPPGAVIAWLLADDEALPDASVAAAGEAVSAGSLPAPNGRLLASPNARRVAGELQVALSTAAGTGPGGRIVSEDVEAAAALAVAASAAALPAPATGSPNGAALTTAVPATNLTPLVRKHAREAGVDLSSVRGSGPGGRILRGDLEAARGSGVAAPAEQQTVRVVPLTGMRGAIASRMHASLTEMAQLTHGFEVDMTAVVALRAQLKAEWNGSGPATPSLNDFVVLAAARALEQHPRLNATVREDGIHELRDIHVGVAVAVPDGLLVPVVTHAAARSLVDLAAETRTLAKAARAGSLSLDQLDGATFVVTSLGGYGVDFFTPVINPGNVAILGVGQLRDGVRWDGDVPQRTRVLTLSLTFDHRAVDGAPAAAYLQTVASLLRRPLRLLAA